MLHVSSGLGKQASCELNNMLHVSSGQGKQASCELNTCYTCHLSWKASIM